MTAAKVHAVFLTSLTSAVMLAALIHLKISWSYQQHSDKYSVISGLQTTHTQIQIAFTRTLK